MGLDRTPLFFRPLSLRRVIAPAAHLSQEVRSGDTKVRFHYPAVCLPLLFLLGCCLLLALLSARLTDLLGVFFLVLLVGFDAAIATSRRPRTRSRANTGESATFVHSFAQQTCDTPAFCKLGHSMCGMVAVLAPVSRLTIRCMDAPRPGGV